MSSEKYVIQTHELTDEETGPQSRTDWIQSIHVHSLFPPWF